MAIIKNCLVCSTEFKTYPCKIKAGKGKYCGMKCCLSVTTLTGEEGVATRWKKGQKAHNFKGWRFTRARNNGKIYKQIYKPDHPHASKAGYVREHRLVMEQVLGRYLQPHEVVDHIDGNATLNNNPSNLRVMTKREHDRMNTPLNIHKRWQKKSKGLQNLAVFSQNS